MRGCGMWDMGDTEAAGGSRERQLWIQARQNALHWSSFSCYVMRAVGRYRLQAEPAEDLSCLRTWSCGVTQWVWREQLPSERQHAKVQWAKYWESAKAFKIWDVWLLLRVLRLFSNLLPSVITLFSILLTSRSIPIWLPKIVHTSGKCLFSYLKPSEFYIQASHFQSWHIAETSCEFAAGWNHSPEVSTQILTWSLGTDSTAVPPAGLFLLFSMDPSGRIPFTFICPHGSSKEEKREMINII